MSPSNYRKPPAKKIAREKKTYWNGGVPSLGPVERHPKNETYPMDEYEYEYDDDFLDQPKHHHHHHHMKKCQGCSPCCGPNMCCSGYNHYPPGGNYCDPNQMRYSSSCSNPPNTCYSCLYQEGNRGYFPPAIPPPPLPYPYPSLGANYYPYDVWGGYGGYGQGNPGYGGLC